VARAKVDGAALEAALADVARGIPPVDAAKRHGVGKTRLYDEVTKRRATGKWPPPQAAPAPVPRQPAPRDPGPPEEDPTDEAPIEGGTVSDLERMDRLARLGTLVGQGRALLRDIIRIRPKPVASREELEALAGPDAEDVLAKLEAAVSARESEAVAARVCLWCRAPLDVVADLRAALVSGDVVGTVEALVVRIGTARSPPAPRGPG
jgi:hypothetical protein